MTLVKICGITNLSDALACASAGADALGFNFYIRSPRYIEPTLTRQIIERLPNHVLTVGVFVNEESPFEVERIADIAGVTAVQLHGDESPEYCAAVHSAFVIKALRVKQDRFDAQSVSNYKTDAIMLDAYDSDLRGGTGQVADWSISRQARPLVAKLFLAGGLSPENVSAAIAAVHPFAVDACSALEVSPGKKDVERVRAFVRIAHEEQ